MGQKQPYLKHVDETDRRGVSFLIVEEGRVNAYGALCWLEKWSAKHFADFGTYVGNWCDGHNIKTQAHPWDSGEALGKKYPNSFVFKPGNHRFYGYRYHPKERPDNFDAVVLICHDAKYEKNTDETNLKIVAEYRLKYPNLPWPNAA